MTNREKYAEQLMKISFRGNRVAIVNGIPVSCGELSNCHLCDFEGADDCRELYHAWLDAEADETTAVKTAEVSAHNGPKTGKTISIAAMNEAYIQTVNDAISGGGSTGDEKLDMATLYGAWTLYKRIMEKIESEE